jgi:hypothetical protein
VFKDSPLAFKGQFPEPQAPVQGKPVIVSLSVVRRQLSRLHVMLSVSGRWRHATGRGQSPLL